MLSVRRDCEGRFEAVTDRWRGRKRRSEPPQPGGSTRLLAEKNERRRKKRSIRGHAVAAPRDSTGGFFCFFRFFRLTQPVDFTLQIPVSSTGLSLPKRTKEDERKEAVGGMRWLHPVIQPPAFFVSFVSFGQPSLSISPCKSLSHLLAHSFAVSGQKSLVCNRSISEPGLT